MNPYRINSSLSPSTHTVPASVPNKGGSSQQRAHTNGHHPLSLSSGVKSEHQNRHSAERLAVSFKGMCIVKEEVQEPVARKQSKKTCKKPPVVIDLETPPGSPMAAKASTLMPPKEKEVQKGTVTQAPTFVPSSTEKGIEREK